MARSRRGKRPAANIKRYSALAAVCFTAKGTVTLALIVSRGRVATALVERVEQLPILAQFAAIGGGAILGVLVIVHTVKHLRARWGRFPSTHIGPKGDAMYHDDIRIEPARRKVVSAQEYLRLWRSPASGIVSARIVPAKLGSSAFGRIRIVLRRPSSDTPAFGHGR